MSAAVEDAHATSGQGKAAKPPAGQDASKRMHDYLLNQKRRKEDYFLRKYGKVIQPPKEAVEPKERPITLPPLVGPHPGSPPAPIFQAKGPIATFPNNASVVIDKAQQHRGLDRHHKLADIHYRPVAPPAHQAPHLPPLPRSRERSREGSGPGTPVKEPSSLSAQQQQQHLDHLGGAPSAALPLLQQQQLRHVQLQQHLQQQQQRLQQQGVVDSSLLGRGPGEAPHGAMKQDGPAFPGGAHGHHTASPRSQRPQLDPLMLQPSQGKLQPLSRQTSRSRGLSHGEGSAGEVGRPKKTGMRDLEVELSVIKAIRSREEVVDRLRTATLKVDHALGGGSPLVLNLNDPLLKMFFRLVTQLRHRTLETIEAIGAWHRRTDSAEPFMFANVGNYLAYIGSDLAFLDKTPFVKHRLYSVKAVEDPFLTEVTPDGVPIDPASTVDLRRNAKFTADALRIRMAWRILCLHGSHGRPPTGSTHADQPTPSSLVSGQDDSFVDGQHPGDDGTPHSRAESLAPLKEGSSAWEGGASAGPSAPESPQYNEHVKHAHHEHQLEGGGREHMGVEGPQAGVAPKGDGFELEGQAMCKEGDLEQQAGAPESDGLNKKVEQQQQQQQHAAQKGQYEDQLDGQHIAGEEEKDAGGVGEPEQQLRTQSSGLTAQFFEKEEQERVLQEQVTAAAAAEAAQQQQRLQEEWRQRDLADQRARQQLQEEEEREAARLREEEEQQRFVQAEEDEEERFRMEVEHHRQHELSLQAQREQLAERQKQQAERERQQELLVEELSAAQYARQGHPDGETEAADEGVVLDSMLDAMVSSLEEPYSSQVLPGGFTYQGWVLDRQRSAEIKESGPASPTPAEWSQTREQQAMQQEQGLPVPLEISSPSQQAHPSPPSPQQPSQSPQALQPSPHLASSITSQQPSHSHVDHITEGEGIHAEEVASPARSEGLHTKGDEMDPQEEHINADDDGTCAEDEQPPPEIQPSFGMRLSTELPTPHLTPHAIPNPALEVEPRTQFEVDQQGHAGGMKEDEETAQQPGTQFEVDQQEHAGGMKEDEEAAQQPGTQFEVVQQEHAGGVKDNEEAAQQPAPVDQVDLHSSGERQPADADYEQHDIDQVVSELVQDVDAGGGEEGGVQESRSQDEQLQQQDDGQASEGHEAEQESQGSGDRNGQEGGEENPHGSSSGEANERVKGEGGEGRDDERAEAEGL